jgi:stearoyl-CoA desaturase (delta-9 desaturase)
MKAARLEKLVAGISMLIPTVSLIPVAILFGRDMLTWADLALFLVMSVLGILGITVGYHRLFSHASFRVGRRMKMLLAILGSMSAQGPVLYWVDIHRRHHQLSDQAADPHSPYHYGGVLTLKGFLRSHLAWMFEEHQHEWSRTVRDILNDRDLLFVHQMYFHWLALGLILPGCLALAFSWSLLSFGKGVLIGGLFRIFVVHHITWSVNSFCHSFGSRDYETTDRSRNFWPVGLLALGEGWHNNHHAFPYSVRHGLKFWQLDLSYLCIRLLAFLKLASQLKYPKEKNVDS